MAEIKFKPDYIFETSWEVCNKVGGIYTVISTKAITQTAEYKDNLILIGPDVWKETRQNPDFIEDKYLYKLWREKAEDEGLRFKIGRWNVAGNPVAILVDFTQYFSEKDKIFSRFWESYQLDSLSGQWDYTEPALFGYAAAKVIESFYEFNISSHDKIVAQFHEWMTGTGILYLREKCPQIGCVFITHATVLGRCIAGSGMPIYRDMESYNNNEMAKNFDVGSKYSLEKLSAVNADSFATVSWNTAKESIKFLERNVDIITPSGFEDSFVPHPDEFGNKRKTAREKLITVAQTITNQKITGNPILILNSGRYEFKNKGIDVFIDSLGKLNKNENLAQKIIAFISVPANQYGARKEITERIKHCDYDSPITDDYLTHGLYDVENDAVIRRIKENGLRNLPEDKVKIIFVPSYLDGKDGIFNMHYYDLLIGFDISVFPSYYEPWGYTPLESIAFHIPTITTSLTGFGQWVESIYNGQKPGVTVIKRTDDNERQVAGDIADYILNFTLKSDEERNIIRENAYEISRSALWENLIDNYKQAYSIALEKVDNRTHLFSGKRQVETQWQKPSKQDITTVWKKIFVTQNIPEKLVPLQKLSKNLWWSWNYDAIELFEMIDNELWMKMNRNPVALLQSLSGTKLKELEQNEEFLTRLEIVFARFEKYMSKAANKPKQQTAYFSMEFGMHDSLQIFSGGLGILAGDYLKEASDNNMNIVGIGLLYRYGYFRQQISITGDQVSRHIPQKFTLTPLKPVRDDNDNWVHIKLALPGRVLHAKVWVVDVGRIPLYLLDTDIEENSDEDRSITHELYGGNWENRFKQELLLGVGGIRVLDTLHIKPDLYHCNEGHAAFIGLERLRKYVQEDNLSFNEAIEVVRASSLFTTHTPVPAGHDTFDEHILRTYIPHYAERLGISWEAFMGLGRMDENNPNENFSMSVLAAKLSQEVNGVSRIHGRVTREMFVDLYKGYYPEESHIGYVTNGVHMRTWAARPWQILYKKEFGLGFYDDQSNSDWWHKIYKVPDQTIWEIRQNLRKELIDYLKIRLTDELTKREEDPKLIFKVIDALNENALTIGFARRFATYKRAHLLFADLERLAEIVNNKEKPVQFIYAGKAHPHDKAGQDLIKKIINISKSPQFLGKIIFVENYDIELAKKLVQGVDVWLNTPTRPLEASGTSGEKAIMNGVLNFSVLDGWWAEGYIPNAGWALKEERTYQNQLFQDELDAETIYSMFEDDIIPPFYNIGAKEVPVKWVSYIKNNIADICPRFTMKRMIDDYYEKYYFKMLNRSAKIKENNYALARKIANWKNKLIRGWESIEVISIKIPDSSVSPLLMGDGFKTEIVLDTNEIPGEDIGIEVLFGQKENDEVKQILFKEEMKIESVENHHATFSCQIPTNKAGVFDFAFRIFPKNKYLPHRQDFNILKWV
ncbi:MAG: alpha-glucan family phosphorylase [Bacteroidia bacterium]|nr:alpha-glucan family phosphorylase [Bacteroidia bacterium]